MVKDLKIWCGICIFNYCIENGYCDGDDLIEIKLDYDLSKHTILDTLNHMNDYNDGFILCMPLSFSKTPPLEQKNCTIEKCPQCKEDMWVSKKKRELREIVNNTPNVLLTN